MVMAAAHTIGELSRLGAARQASNCPRCHEHSDATGSSAVWAASTATANRVSAGPAEASIACKAASVGSDHKVA